MPSTRKEHKLKRKPRFYVDDEGKNQITYAKSEKPEDEICDFCLGTARPYTVYLANEFVILPIVFEPEWDACSICSKLIDARDQEGLLQNSIKGFNPSPEQVEDVREIQSRFFENLKGKQ